MSGKPTKPKERSAIQQAFKERLDENELMNCMRCGFCLPACPTYLETQKEAASPRGRIALMKAVYDGKIEPDDDVQDQLDLCLGCRACEPVCPSGVKYGHLLEQARGAINENKKKSLKEKAIRRLVFRDLFPHQKRMRQVTGLIRLYQRSGLKKLAEATGALQLLPEGMRDMQHILPPIVSAKRMKARPVHLKAVTPHYHVKTTVNGRPVKVEKGKIDFQAATAEGESPRSKPIESTKRVAFFAGCLMDTMFLETNNATMKLLQLAGCDIVNPPRQACCGALHGHSGELQGAHELAKRNIQAFEDLDVDYIVTNAGGCGAFLIDYDHLLKDDPEWSARAKQFVEKIKDISVILLESGFLDKIDLRLPSQRVTYQDSCHLRNVMGTGTAPRQLLRSIEGVDYHELKEADVCCGSAGIYNLIQEEMATQLIDRKMAHVKDIAPQVIVTSNPGCLLQMKLGIKRAGLEGKMEAVHLVDLLLKSVDPNLFESLDEGEVTQ
ncbi:glycolate oxidase iron-sulfur subunit [Pullulanibacillus pueri]|uniref:Glycolate oxidase iron-sulfur subunit n=1 Tax=Pullulanibacillus pueri TaxID=1437324 RepID=A0A8J3EK60_9BACL|nr:(Fe-S)-binding protein [Pullulanibacillus pueri]MBM7681838.1 glycolate oxidase iron-sulfur subunit [Pullulanibacillus pueri]GGH76288.1 glycolate oxidase iron-sulfur subunit [Pullulanibacillus pueri]